MSIIIEEIENVTIRREAFSPDIRISGNPEDTMAGMVVAELQVLEYHDDALTHRTPFGKAGETVGAFVQRAFEVNGKTITGMDLMLAAKQYIVDLHAERAAALSAPVIPAPEPEPEPEPESGE